MKMLEKFLIELFNCSSGSSGFFPYSNEKKKLKKILCLQGK